MSSRISGVPPFGNRGDDRACRLCGGAHGGIPSGPASRFSERLFPRALAVGEGHPQPTLPSLRTSCPCFPFLKVFSATGVSELEELRTVRVHEPPEGGEGWCDGNLSVRPL